MDINQLDTLRNSSGNFLLDDIFVVEKPRVEEIWQSVSLKGRTGIDECQDFVIKSVSERKIEVKCSGRLS